MEWLNYHHLRYFWVVAKEGGLKKTAEKLHVSLPSISEQIKELEEALCQPLFRRSGRWPMSRLRAASSSRSLRIC